MAVENEEETVETPEGGEPAADTSLLDSINEALAPTLPAENADTSAVENAEDDDALDEESEETEETDDSDKPRGADGKFLKAGDKPTAAADVAKLGPDGKPLPVEPAKKTDAVNDPIPDEVKGRTRERMTSLISTVKTQGEMIATQNQLFDSIQSTGASPEEFGAMLGYMRWVHSDKPEDLKQAQALLQSELEGISLKLGQAAPGVDFLAKFPDLQAKVDNGQITTEDAQEIALHRQRTNVSTARTTQQQTQEATAQAATQARNAGIAELNTLGTTLNSTDPEYVTKHEILSPILASLGQLPPASWKNAFMQAYKAITPAQVARFKATGEAAPVVQKKPAGNQPLRANKSPSGGQQRGPTSLLDAISSAVDEAG